MAQEANWVSEESSTTGTGDFTLNEQTQYRAFSDEFSTGGTDKFYYHIRHLSSEEMEFGTGHLSDSTTLVRDTVLQSTNSNSLVSFSTGTKEVICQGGLNSSGNHEFDTLADNSIDTAQIATDAVTTTEANFTDQQLGTGDDVKHNFLAIYNTKNTFVDFGRAENDPLSIHFGKTPGADYNFGTTYIGFNARHESSGDWTFHSDGNNSGGGVIDVGLAGDGFRFYTRSTGSGVDETITSTTLMDHLQFKIEPGLSNSPIIVDGNADLDVNTNNLLNAGKVQLSNSGPTNGITAPDQGGGTTPEIYLNSSGEWIAKDDDGNTFTLTA